MTDGHRPANVNLEEGSLKWILPGKRLAKEPPGIPERLDLEKGAEHAI